MSYRTPAAGTEPEKPSRSRRWVPWVSAAAVVTVLAAGTVSLYVAPAFQVDRVEVTGVELLAEQEVLAAMEDVTGRALITVDTATQAQAVAALPAVAKVSIKRAWPDVVDVTITERVPVLQLDDPDSAELIYVDAKGVEFFTGPPVYVPLLNLEGNAAFAREETHAAALSEATQAAVIVLDALPAPLREAIVQIDVPSVTDLSLVLADGRTVVWGSTDRTQDKARAMGIVLGREGGVWNITNPEMPTVR